ncbi:uncharacterized protein LOC114543515 [Dendronephthya gigantea]|uniref:uncharacterized protein LOC114543515 n=1 Tax=Dendronephthya gigantea TaxID=151771 RepID=UPI001069C230|nr:uncharacterized protein LOC114543515 [Dendronephthya gigantea]
MTSSETEQSAVQLKRAKSIQGPNAYNLFCSNFFKSDECKGLSHSEKNKLAAEKWSHQNSDQKEKYRETAKAINCVKIDQLDEVQKRKIIERHIKKLQEEIIVLEDLGCQISSLMVDNMGVVFQIGSNQGNQFLSCNPEIGIKF